MRWRGESSLILSVLNSQNINPPSECLKKAHVLSLSLCRPFSKSQETQPAPNLSIIPLAPPVHPGDSHAPCRGPAAISRPVQELHNGDAQLGVKASVSRTTNQPDDMDTDGEIDVDNCDDRECKTWTDLGVT